ncbi:hypothetical protein [Streptomyces sp. NPDC090025]|uniref:hypothetical protein n=1 Tax=Streptomyces sp. NPDC090025 TaxID=3365922 RepID=UPI003838BB28
MIWWCKVRAVPVIALATIGTVALGLLVGNLELPVPVLVGQSGQFLLAHLMTLIPAVTLLYGFGRGETRTEGIAVRDLRSWDAALGLLVAAGGMLAAVLSHVALSSDLAVILGRNVAGYVGLALLLHPVLGTRLTGATLAAIPLVLAASGWGPSGDAKSWAWLLHPADSTLAMATALGAVCVGATTTAFWTRPPLRIDT